jgi:hypothetical protein
VSGPRAGARSLVLLALLVSCAGERSPSGIGEPIRVRNGVLKEGPLPAGPGPAITAIETASTVLRPGQGEKTLSGRASPGASAIALALGGRGNGYWLVGVDGPDPLNAGELGWQALVEIARDVPPGLADLLVVAIDASGVAGPVRSLPVCIPGALPDNLNACDRNLAPPAAVVSLSWDTPVDLDLVVVAPDGRVIDAKHPRVLPGADGGAATTSAIDRDSNGACVLDRIQRENLVFQEAPPPGSYLVFANLFDACGRAPVHFRVAVSERQPSGDGTLSLVETLARDGVLLGVDANGGSRLGTYVTEVTF